MSRAKDLLEAAENGDDPTLGASLLFPGVELLSIHELSVLADKAYGEQVSDDLIQLSVFNKIPADPEPLKKFLTGRPDLISLRCLQKLEN